MWVALCVVYGVVFGIKPLQTDQRYIVICANFVFHVILSDDNYLKRIGLVHESGSRQECLYECT